MSDYRSIWSKTTQARCQKLNSSRENIKQLSGNAADAQNLNQTLVGPGSNNQQQNLAGCDITEPEPHVSLNFNINNIIILLILTLIFSYS